MSAVAASDPARKARVMDASKLNEAVGDRYGPALGRVFVRVMPGVGLRMASVVGCMHISD
jgi:hypothetical protein